MYCTCLPYSIVQEESRAASVLYCPQRCLFYADVLSYIWYLRVQVGQESPLEHSARTPAPRDSLLLEPTFWNEPSCAEESLSTSSRISFSAEVHVLFHRMAVCKRQSHALASSSHSIPAPCVQRASCHCQGKLDGSGQRTAAAAEHCFDSSVKASVGVCDIFPSAPVHEFHLSK